MTNATCETKKAIQPRVDICKTETGVKLEAELPGVTKENAVVEVRDGQLIIEGKRNGTDVNATWRLRERPRADFYRAFALGDTLDTEKIEANLENGVLTIALNKRPELAPNKIVIN